MNDKIILTGIKPTGTPHLGNYVGALNLIKNPSEIRQHTYEIAALFIALGLNLDNAVLFRQSDIVEVYQLSNMLMNVTPKGLMNRAHSYKAIMEKNTAVGVDVDSGVNMGLYTYPVLMAADILLYNSDIVPVGADQKQHVEFARDIAGYFNNTYGNIFKMPEPVIGKDTGLIPGLDGRKMSKSYDNTIPLFASESELKKKVMRIITDSKLPDEPKDPDTSTIVQLYRHFATQSELDDLRNKFISGGMGYGDAKKILFEKINSVLAEPRDKYNYLMSHTDEIDKILDDGAKRARVVAQKTFARVKKAMLG